ncbi:MAG: DsbA family protein [Polyangiales bacterium]
MKPLTAIRSTVISAYLGENVLRLQRGAQRAIAAMRRKPRVLSFYYRVDDAQSHLLAQTLSELADRTSIEIDFIVVPTPHPNANPEPEWLRNHDANDAVLLAERYDLSFPRDWKMPSDDRIRRVQAALLVPRPPHEQLLRAIELGDALWRDEGHRLGQIVDEIGTIEGQDVRVRLESNREALTNSGHYQSAMIFYRGEWYWGVDRLWHLLSRLADEGVQAGDVLVERPLSVATVERLRGEVLPKSLDVFFSFRSPYSYLLIERIHRDFGHLDSVDLVLKPVLPMVNRGFEIPKEKKMYIVRDAAREARKRSIRFGKICDPLGKGIERAMAVWLAADSEGKGFAFVHSAMRGIWSEWNRRFDRPWIAICGRACDSQCFCRRSRP